MVIVPVPVYVKVANPLSGDCSMTVLSSVAATAVIPSVLAVVPPLRISAFDRMNFVSKFLSLPEKDD